MFVTTKKTSILPLINRMRLPFLGWAGFGCLFGLFMLTTMPLTAPLIISPAYAQDDTRTATNIIDLDPSKPASQSFVQEVLTLDQAIEIGLNYNPNLEQQRWSQRAVATQIDQARAGFLPNINITGDAGYEITRNSTTSQGPGNNRETLFRRQANLTISQLIFDGQNTLNEVRLQKNRNATSSYQTRSASEQLAFQIINAYYNIQAQRQILFLADQNITDHQLILEKIHESVAAGRSSIIDEKQVITRLSSARAQRLQTTASLHIAQANFKRFVGQFPGSLQATQSVQHFIPQDLETLLQGVEETNPSLKGFAHNVKAATNQYDQAFSAYLPRVTFDVSANASNSLSGVDALNQSASAMFVLNWNLYAGGADTARREELSKTRLAQQDNLNNQIRIVKDNLRQAYENRLAAISRRDKFTKQSEHNRRLIAAYLDQFQLGRRSLLDVLNAQSELFGTLTGIVNEQTTIDLQTYNILLQQGKLLEALNMGDIDHYAGPAH